MDSMHCTWYSCCDYGPMWQSIRLHDTILGKPCAGSAVSVTLVPAGKDAAHTEPQLIPAGEDVTVPAPLPLSVTLSV